MSLFPTILTPGVAYMNLKAFASARASLYKAGVLAPNDLLIRAVAPPATYGVTSGPP